MLLIAESGATKTSWVLVHEDRIIRSFSSDGMSPVIHTQNQITHIIESQVVPQLGTVRPSQIAFYGTGVSSEDRVAVIKQSLQVFYPEAEMEVEHDLLAAARAAYEGEITIAAILGTGSNSCVYDGNAIIAHVPSLAYILGDEGSGAYMGKKLLRDFVYGKMPAHIHATFEKKYGIDKDIIIDHVYKKPDPSRWLASFSPFLEENINEAYCRSVVTESFRDFFNCHISSYGEYKTAPLNVIGSIGMYFREFLEQVCKEYGFTFGRIIQSPIEELVRYHIERNKKG